MAKHKEQALQFYGMVETLPVIIVLHAILAGIRMEHSE